MKLFGILAIVAVMSLLMAGCVESNAADATPTLEEQPPSPPADQPAAEGVSITPVAGSDEVPPMPPA